MAPTPEPEPIPPGTAVLVVRGVTPDAVDTFRELAGLTGYTIILLAFGQELEALTEDQMGRAGWCRCPSPGFDTLRLT